MQIALGSASKSVYPIVQLVLIWTILLIIWKLLKIESYCIYFHQELSCFEAS